MNVCVQYFGLTAQLTAAALWLACVWRYCVVVSLATTLHTVLHPAPGQPRHFIVDIGSSKVAWIGGGRQAASEHRLSLHCNALA